MAPSTLDRRKKYTRMVLKDSLMTLLKKEQLSSVTVKDICRLADINRSTFYSHYKDQYDLLEKIEEELIADLTGHLKQCNFKKTDNFLPMIENLLSYFASKHDVCLTLLNKKSESAFQTKVITIAHEYFKENEEALSHLDEELMEYYGTFIISGCIQVMKAWLSNGMDKTPREIAEMLNHLINKGLFGETLPPINSD